MNTELRTEAKNGFRKDIFKLITNSVLGKKLENVRKHIDIRLLTGDRKSYFVVRTKLSYNKMIFRNVLGTEMNKTKVKMNKPIYICMLILETQI